MALEETDLLDTQKDTPLVLEARRLDVVCGPTGRRRWSLSEKARIVAESFRGDMPVSAVARRNDLRPNQLFLWRRQAREGKFVLAAEDLDIGFAPIMVEPELAAKIEIAVDGVEVRVCAATPAARIAEIAAALCRSR